MNRRQRSSILRWLIVAAVVTVVIIYLLQPARIEVETAVVDVGTIEQKLEAEGKVRLADKHLVTMPVSGEFVFVDIEPGDTIAKGQIVAYYRVLLLDERTKKEVAERVVAAEQAVAVSQAQTESIEPGMKQLEKQVGRLQRLVRQGASPVVELEQLQIRYDEARKQYEAAAARTVQARHELLALQRGTLMASGKGQPLRSPRSGVLLRRFEDQSRVLAAGMPICEIGSLDAIEIVSDVLSRDAQQLHPGMHARIAVGNGDTIPGVVDRVEPAARTKISALGIEEQRVDVIVKPRTAPSNIGDAYRVEIEITLWSADSLMRVPRNAILIDEKDTFCYAVTNGKAIRQNVRIGRMSGSIAEILSGIAQGSTIVVNPPRALGDGARVRAVP